MGGMPVMGHDATGIVAQRPGLGRRSALSARPAVFAPGSERICGIASALRLPGFEDFEAAASSSWERPWPQPVDPPKDVPEQRSGHRYLGQLEHDVAAMAHDPGTDLDQLLA
jgi:hypothetical protein